MAEPGQTDYAAIAAALKHARERAPTVDGQVAVDYAIVQVCDGLQREDGAQGGQFSRDTFLQATGYGETGMLDREIAAAAERRAQQDQIVETRPGHADETYEPNTPWLRQDQSPHPVPEHDADGGDWRITGQGLHVGSHNGEDYCLEWLPTELLPEEPATPPGKAAPGPQPVAEVEEDLRHEREERRPEPGRKTGPVLGVSQDDGDREAL